MARTKQTEPKRETCYWTLASDDDFWETDCGQAFQPTDGTPRENKMRFCCYCGKLLEVK